jgi:hypothetical protein
MPEHAVMTLDVLQGELARRLLLACQAQPPDLRAALAGQQVFAYALFCRSGCRGMDIAACTRAGLARQQLLLREQGLPESYGEVHAAEWDYVHAQGAYFQDVERCIDELHETFYEGEIEGVDLDALDADELDALMRSVFAAAIVGTLEVLREAGSLAGAPFEDDLLLGVQFGDPGEGDARLVLAVPERLNAAHWHRKVLAAFSGS